MILIFFQTRDENIISRKLGTSLSGEALADISKHLQLIPLQREVLESFPDFQEYHLFGDYDMKVQLCKNLLLKESSFVLTLVEILNLDFKKITKITFEYLVSKEETSGVEDVIQILVEWQKRRLIPYKYEMKSSEVTY